MHMNVAFLGSKGMGADVLSALARVAPDALVGIVTPDDSQDERSVTGRLQEIATRHGRPLHIAGDTSATVSALTEMDADIAIVCGWYRLIPLDAVRTRFYGLHGSLLPRYRGQAPIPWQIICGESRVGVSLFQFSDGIDEGDIVGQASAELGPDETVADALTRISALSVRLVETYLPRLIAGTAAHEPQDHAAATYCGPRQPSDGEIDWTQPAQRIHDFVRAQTRPYPGAFTLLPDGRKMYVWRTRLDRRTYAAVPGSVCERGDELIVGCGDGVVRLTDVSVRVPEVRIGTRLGRPAERG